MYDITCDRCKGEGFVVSGKSYGYTWIKTCSKCKGNKLLDWVEFVIGSRRKEDFNWSHIIDPLTFFQKNRITVHITNLEETIRTYVYYKGDQTLWQEIYQIFNTLKNLSSRFIFTKLVSKM